MDIPMETEFPNVTKALIKSLDQLYPDSCANPTDEDRLIWIKVGQRNVVNFLIEQHKRQNETIR